MNLSAEIKFTCPNCQAILGAPVKLKGKKGNCPSCKKEILVPEKSEKIDGQTEEKEQKQQENQA